MAQFQVKFSTPAIVRDGDQVILHTEEQIMEFGTLNDFYDACLMTQEDAVKLAVLNRIADDPNLDSPEKWNGGTFTLDTEKALASQMCKFVSGS